MNLAFVVNNQGIVLDQEFPNGKVTVKWENGGKVDPDHMMEIDGKQFIELLRLYHYVMENNIQIAYINPHGTHYDNGEFKCRITYRLLPCSDGKYEIGRRVDKNGVRGKEWRVRRVYKGNYDWTDYGFGKSFPENAAVEHIKQLAKRDAEHLRGQATLVVNSVEEYRDED